MRAWFVAAVAAAACGSTDAGGGANKPYVPKVPPAVDAAPMTDASTAAVDTSTPAADWWKQGAAACPNGGQLEGDPAPKGDHVWCVRADKQEGPDASWDADGSLWIGAYKDGRRHGGFVAFYPDGKKHRVGAYRAGNEAGAWTTWWPNGKVQLEEHYVDGRADGTQTAYAQDGKVVETWKLAMGTGTMEWWDDHGHKGSETEYVDGRPQGTRTFYYPSGQVESRVRLVEGDEDGEQTDYYETGQISEHGTYARGVKIGDWASFDEHGAQTRLVRRDGKGRELLELLYDGGAPLVPVPAPGPCDEDAGVEKAATGHVHTGDMPECVERPRHFPGLAVTGNYAYDAGCMGGAWVVDCKAASAPDSKTVLARGGWAKAKGKLREELAEAYIDEVAMLWDGSTTSGPDPETAVVNADGSVVVTAWTGHQVRGRNDPTIARIAWTFTADGVVTQKTIGTGTRK